MTERPIPNKAIEERGRSRPSLAEQVEARARLKLKAQRATTPGIWFGLGMMGLIGWTVVVPTLIGAALGIWLDRRHPGGHSWTLALLSLGLLLGCLNAWKWITKEQKAMSDQGETQQGDESDD